MGKPNSIHLELAKKFPETNQVTLDSKKPEEEKKDEEESFL